MRLITILIIAIFCACTPTKELQESKRFPQYEGLDAYLQKIFTEVESHDEDGILALMDNEYKKEQLDDFHKGNKTRFLNELFCGTNSTTEKFECPKFNSILSIEAGAIQEENDVLRVLFKLKTENGLIQNEGLIKIVRNNNNIQYELFGAVG